MTADELKAHLQTVYDQIDRIGITIYAILKVGEEIEPKKLDIEGDSLPDLRKLFIERLKTNILDKEEISVLNLSKADDRTNAIYIYDLDIPDELAAMDTVTRTDNMPLLDFSKNQFSQIKALLIEIGDNDQQLVLYKSMAPINIFTQSSFFLRKHNKRLKRIEDEFIRISDGFQLMKISGKLLVLELSAIEKLFGFQDSIKRKAKDAIDIIDSISILENVDELEVMIDDIKDARKLAKVDRSSPVLKAKIKNDQIIKFCQTFPSLKGKIRFNEAGDRIRLDTKVSKNLFVKLLMDDFLTSELTKYHYTSHAKDESEETEEDKDKKLLDN